MKDKQQMVGIIERRIRNEGAEEAEVLLVESDRRTATSKARSVTASEEAAAHVRAYLPDGKVGAASAATLRDSDVRAAIARALAKATAATPNPNAGLPPRLDTSTRGLGILDNRYPTIDDGGRLDTVMWNAESCAGVDDDVVVEDFVYEELLHTRTYMATGGRAFTERSTRYRLSGAAHHRETPGITLHKINTSRNFAEVASQPLGVALGRRVVRTRNTTTLPDEARPIVLSQVVVGDLLPRILRAARAERMDSGNSFVQRHAGERIASDHLHVVDDAQLSGGYATRAFDDRGVPGIPITVIREGVLGGAYQGPESARAAKSEARPTGHETFEGELWLGNLIVRPGNRSRNMLFPELGVLTELEELTEPPTLDPTGERITLTGHVWVKSEKTDLGYVGVRTLQCSIPELLGSVIHVYSDHERHGIVDSPTWILKGVWFTE